MAETVSISGLSLDIVGVLLLLFATSQKRIELALWVTAVDTDWITADEQIVAQNRRAMTLFQRVYQLAITLIVVGFSLQIVGQAL